jgi:polyisoprenoid-binding protein YceI
MRIQFNRGLMLGAFLGTAAFGPPALAPLSFQPESRVWLEGSSTLRDFKCDAAKLEGSVGTAAAATDLAVDRLQATVRSAEVIIPVADLDCGNGTMNGHLRKALKAGHHPLIRFQMVDHRVVAAKNGEGTVTMTGKLDIAGTEKTVTLDALASRDASGNLRVRGSKELLMADFGVKPPTLMMGLAKVKDRVVVHFDVALAS